MVRLGLGHEVGEAHWREEEGGLGWVSHRVAGKDRETCRKLQQDLEASAGGGRHTVIYVAT